MTDKELDDMLDQWTAPPVPPAWRKRAKERLAPAPRRVNWRRSLVAAGALAAAAFFLVVIQATPQTRTPPVPWSVDSEFIRYADDGTATVEMYSTSYESNGNEVLLSRSIPGNLFETELARATDASLPSLYAFHLHITSLLRPALAAEMERARRSRPPGVQFLTGCDVDTGCLMLEHFSLAAATPGEGCLAGDVVGRATMLNHAVEAVRQRWTEHGRMTVWTAPDLACFALKVTHEEERPDGTFRLVSARRALRVTLNP